MAFTKITAAGIGSTETVTLDGLSVINNGSFGGNLTVGGVLTYEDVTNVDSVGLITARNGVVVGSGITLSKDGDIFATGIVTATRFSGSGENLSDVIATRLTLTDQSGDTSCNVLFAQSSTGNQLPHTGSNLTFNSVTGQLTATKFAGDGSDLTGMAAGGAFVKGVIGVTSTTPVGIETSTVTRKDLIGPAGNTSTGAGSSFHGAYMGDGFLSFNTEFSNPTGYYISTFTNALVAGPMQLGTTLSIDGTFTIV